MPKPAPMIETLLLEPATLLRRTVALTARSLGLANVHEAATGVLAEQLMRRLSFDGMVIAIDADAAAPGMDAIALLDFVRHGQSASKPGIPIAVLAEHVDASMLQQLQMRGITRIILKPFRARAVIDTFTAFGQARDQPGLPYRVEHD